MANPSLILGLFISPILLDNYLYYTFHTRDHTLVAVPPGVQAVNEPKPLSRKLVQVVFLI